MPAAVLRPPNHRIEKRAIWWWVVRAVATYVPLLGALAVASALWEPARPWLAIPAGLAVCGFLLHVLVAPRWRFAVHRWESTDDAVYALTGWYVQEWRVAPLSRVQTVDAVRGPLERLFGLASLKVTTASSSGPVTIVGLDHQTATDLADRLTAIVEQVPGDAT